VRDYDEAKNWYTEKLGFVTLIDQKFGPSQRFVLIAPAGSVQEDVSFVLEKTRRDDPTMPIDYTDRVGKEVNMLCEQTISPVCAQSIATAASNSGNHRNSVHGEAKR
jgi:hypothetical protein